jgi:predicted ATPase
LQPLSEEGIGSYLNSRLSAASLPDGLARLIASRTEGNPLFVSHLVDGWIADGALSYEDQGWVLNVDLDALAVGIPDTLRELIEQQIDRLSPGDQEVLAVASVAGIEWSTATVEAGVDQDSDAIEERCAALARAGGLIESRGVVEWPDGTIAAQFGFLHHLYRDVLLARIPVGRQARLHRRIGSRLERGYGPQAAEQAAVLATHFAHGRDPRRAIRYYCAAAAQALASNAHHEAIQHLTDAYNQLPRLPDTTERHALELEIQTTLAPALIPVAGWAAPEVEQAFIRAHELSCQLDTPAETFRVLYGMATMHEYRGEYQRSQMLMEDRLQVPAAPDDPKLLVQAHELLACSLFHQGVLTDALEHADYALSHYRPIQHRVDWSPYAEDLSVGCHVWAAQALWLMGYPDQAVRRAQEAVTLAEQLGHLYSLATARGQLAGIYQFRNQASLAGSWAEASRNLAIEQGFRYRQAIAEMLHGWATAEAGHPLDGVIQLRHGLEIYRSTGASMETPYFLALLASALAASNQVDTAQDTIAEALEMVRDSRSFFYEAELLRLKGSLIQAADPTRTDDAEACFQHSLTIARQQGARSLELRTAVNICRLWLNQGKRGDAHQLVGAIYGQFTEGFDTPDLTEARAMLECLSGSSG